MAAPIRSTLRRIAAAIALALALPATVAAADNPFAPVIYVNGSAITGYEIAQRAKFLGLLRTPGDLDQIAREGLIDDRLHAQAAKALEIEIPDKEVTAGMEEFAKRANLSVEEFVAELGKGGVDPETFRDFVRSGILWRAAVQAKFRPLVVVTRNEVTAAMNDATRKGEVRLLLNELVVPYAPEMQADAQAFMTELRASLHTQEEFEVAAQKYSRSATAPQGGQLDWIPLSNLPGPLASSVLNLGPGAISDVLSVPGSYVLFYVRAISDGATAASSDQELDWAEFLVPKGPNLGADLASVKNRVDNCDDLYTVAKDLPADRLKRTKARLGQVPRDVSARLAKMDPGDTDTALSRGSWQVLLMLCTRTLVPGEGVPDETQVRNELLNRKLQNAADTWQRELRAMAVIREP